MDIPMDRKSMIMGMTRSGTRRKDMVTATVILMENKPTRELETTDLLEISTQKQLLPGPSLGNTFDSLPTTQMLPRMLNHPNPRSSTAEELAVSEMVDTQPQMTSVSTLPASDKKLLLPANRNLTELRAKPLLPRMKRSWMSLPRTRHYSLETVRTESQKGMIITKTRFMACRAQPQQTKEG